VKPAVQARYRSGFFDTWWIDKEKADRISRELQNLRQLPVPLKAAGQGS